MFYYKLAACLVVLWLVLVVVRNIRRDLKFRELTRWLHMDEPSVNGWIGRREWLELFQQTGNKLRERSYLLLFRVEHGGEELWREERISWIDAFKLDLAVAKTRVALDSSGWYMQYVLMPSLPGRIHERLAPIGRELAELDDRIAFFTSYIEQSGRFELRPQGTA